MKAAYKRLKFSLRKVKLKYRSQKIDVLGKLSWVLKCPVFILILLDSGNIVFQHT